MAYAVSPEASFYSAGGNAKYIGYVEASVKTISDTQAQVTVTQYAGMKNGYGYPVNVQSQYSENGGSFSDLLYSSGNLTSMAGSSYVWFAGKSQTYTVPRNGQTYRYRVQAYCPTARSDITSTGWTSSSSYLTVTVPTQGNKTINYSLNYTNLDGSTPTGIPSSQSASATSSITLASAPTRTGYTFLNWNTKQDGTGTGYAAGASYTSTATVTLYAQWQAVTGYPSIDGLQIYRASSSAGTPDSSGEYLYVTGNVNWGAQTTSTAVTAGTVTVATRLSSAESYGTTQTATVTNGVVTYSANGYTSTESYDVLVTITNGNGVAFQYEYPHAITKDGYIFKFAQSDGRASLYVDSTDWAYLYGNASATNSFIRWCCRFGVVYLECYFSNVSSALTTTEWKSTDVSSTNVIAAGYRPSKPIGTPLATFTTAGGGMWVTTDGVVHTQASTTCSYAIGLLSYPVD